MSENTVEFIMADHSRLVAENARLQTELVQVTAERDKLKSVVDRVDTIANFGLGLINVIEKHQRKR